MRVQSEVTSVSWIPSEAVTGLMKLGFATGMSHYDAPPPDLLGDLAVMRDSDAFRFANRLQVWAEFEDGQVSGHGRDGGLVMGSTTVRLGPLGATFAAVAMPDLTPAPEVTADSVTYRQTCGGRTALPLPRRIAHPPFVRLQAPLVWTTLAVTLRPDGSAEARLEGASPFPRHWVYDAQGRLTAKAGLTDWEGWVGQESWAGTPWGEQDSPVVVTAAETALERTLSSQIMRGGARPEIRRLGARRGADPAGRARLRPLPSPRRCPRGRGGRRPAHRTRPRRGGRGACGAGGRAAYLDPDRGDPDTCGRRTRVGDRPVGADRAR